jgi:hypothetical protein
VRPHKLDTLLDWVMPAAGCIIAAGVWEVLWRT